MNPLKAALDRMLADAYAEVSTPLLAAKAEPQPTITVTKSTAYLMLSVDQRFEAGLITEEQARAQGWTPYVPPSVPWSRRLRWRWQSWRGRAGRKVGGWIAGMDLSERDEDW